MATLTERIVGAARLDVRTYEDVENDRSATPQALVVVLLASVAAGIGSIGMGGASPRVILSGAVAAVLGWVTWAVLTYVIGTQILPAPQTRADVGELLRTTGFAQAPGLLRVLGVIPVLGLLAWLASAIWMLVAMVVAVRQALDYTSTGRAVGVCLIGWVASLILAAVVGLFFGPTVS